MPQELKKVKNDLLNVFFFFKETNFFLWQSTKTASICMKRKGTAKVQVTPSVDFVGYLPNICFPPFVFLRGCCLPHVTKQQDPEEAHSICMKLRRRFWFV